MYKIYIVQSVFERKRFRHMNIMQRKYNRLMAIHDCIYMTCKCVNVDGSVFCCCCCFILLNVLTRNGAKIDVSPPRVRLMHTAIRIHTELLLLLYLLLYTVVLRPAKEANNNTRLRIYHRRCCCQSHCSALHCSVLALVSFVHKHIRIYILLENADLSKSR